MENTEREKQKEVYRERISECEKTLEQHYHAIEITKDRAHYYQKLLAGLVIEEMIENGTLGGRENLEHIDNVW